MHADLQATFVDKCEFCAFTTTKDVAGTASAMLVSATMTTGLAGVLSLHAQPLNLTMSVLSAGFCWRAGVAPDCVPFISALTATGPWMAQSNQLSTVS